jgi:hypothetical protein
VVRGRSAKGRTRELESALAARIAAVSAGDAISVLAENLLACQDDSPTRPHPRSPHTGVASRIARRLWRFADGVADDLEGRVVPVRYRRHPKHESAFSHYLLGPRSTTTTRMSRRRRRT